MPHKHKNIMSKVKALVWADNKQQKEDGLRFGSPIHYCAVSCIRRRRAALSTQKPFIKDDRPILNMAAVLLGVNKSWSGPTGETYYKKWLITHTHTHTIL